MKFTCRVVIDEELDKVISLFDNPDNLNKWQDGFVSYEHLSGEPGKPGAKSKLRYKTGSREIELVETIITKNLPAEFSAIYESKKMTNTMKNSFSKIDIHQTEFIAEVEYTKLNGFMPKLMVKLMPAMFKKQTRKWLNNFKRLVEAN